MYLNAQKTADRLSIIAVRDDGVSLRVRTPDRKFSPPHDLIHFVVEKGMHLERGFWGSVADGAKFASVDVIDGRQKPRANERSAQIIKANEANLSEAEKNRKIWCQSMATPIKKARDTQSTKRLYEQ